MTVRYWGKEPHYLVTGRQVGWWKWCGHGGRSPYNNQESNQGHPDLPLQRVFHELCKCLML